jgi:hypothetical protein
MIFDFTDDLCGRPVDTQVDDPVPVVAEDESAEVFADIMDITIDGGQKDRPPLSGYRKVSGQKVECFPGCFR